jgi:hypothetical protein
MQSPRIYILESLTLRAVNRKNADISEKSSAIQPHFPKLIKIQRYKQSAVLRGVWKECREIRGKKSPEEDGVIVKHT